MKLNEPQVTETRLGQVWSLRREGDYGEQESFLQCYIYNTCKCDIWHLTEADHSWYSPSILYLSVLLHSNGANPQARF